MSKRVKRFPIGLQRRLALVLDSIGLMFVILLAWQSTRLVIESLEIGSHATTPLGTPMFIPQLLVPIGLGILGVAIIRHLAKQVGDLLKIRRQD